MAKKIHKQENILDDAIYEKENLPFKRLIITALVLVPFGFILNFPIKDIIRTLVIDGLESNRACPILYSDVEVSYLFPKIIIKSPTITQTCVNSLDENLNIEDIIIRPHLPSFKLPGVRLSVNLRKDQTNIYLYPVIGMNKIQIAIDDSVIHSDFLSYFMGGRDVFDGSFNVSLTADMANNRLKKANIKIESRDLFIKPANINNFIIPELALMDFSLRATLDRSMNLKVAPGNLIIGNKSAPIYTSLGGNVRINNANFPSSQINMNGDMVLTNKFLDLFPIIRLKIQTPTPDGTYKFKARGSIANPGSYNFQ